MRIGSQRVFQGGEQADLPIPAHTAAHRRPGLVCRCPQQCIHLVAATTASPPRHRGFERCRERLAGTRCRIRADDALGK